MLVIDRRRDLPALLDSVGWSSSIAHRKVAWDFPVFVKAGDRAFV
jgi:hypothetical protein